MIRNFELNGDDFLDLAHGFGRTATLQLLRSAQISKHMLLIRMIGSRCANPHWREALAVFEQARTSPHAECILANPWTGVWAARCLRRLERDGSQTSADTLHFNALAAALAIRAGLDADLTLPVRDAMAYLPTLGSALVDDGQTTHLLRVRDGNTATVPDDVESDRARWSGHRWLKATTAETTAHVILDDLSPFRNSFELRLADRLNRDELIVWRRMWEEAWSLLLCRAPNRVAELLSCLNTAVPLSASSGKAGFSATARDAFGAIALSRPPDSVNLAVTMVHEAQHAKLGALLDLMDLYKISSDTYFAPWRRDPRPIGGLIQGTYAFLGIADTWLRFSADPNLEASAIRQFAHVREQVAAAITSLEAAPSLTDHGQLFVEGMRASLDGMLSVNLPRAIVVEARADLRRVYVAWCEANGRG